MAWSARREGMILEVGDVPDDVALFINAKADTEGKSVDAVACELLATALRCSAQPKPEAARQTEPRPTWARRVYGVAVVDNRLTIESAAVLNETDLNVIVERRMPSYENYKHIKKRLYDGTPRPIAFSPREAAEQFLERRRGYLANARRTEPDQYWTAAGITQHIAHHEQWVRAAEALLASVTN